MLLLLIIIVLFYLKLFEEVLPSECLLGLPSFFNMIDNMRKNVTSRRVRITIIAVEKHYILYILGVCL